ncbi:hypothetical protein RB653_006038 [Dictyostelium firmibasis]|uniref:Kinesin motor domain-containing protein n=1 Tax=Dictyostelium firmibasis TaxID=79012 RepID=A0AAN7U8R4_9MYCE
MESPIVEGNSGEVATPTLPQQPQPVSSNIRVVCRVRPLTELEKGKNEHSIVHFFDSNSISIRANGPQFTFDRIFGFGETQSQIFEDVAEPIVNDFLDGYHGTIIAYGQTASGKTFTMVGDPSSHGIIPRVIESIFLGISKMREKDTSLSLAFCLKISALELYNEKLYDLYDSSKSNLNIREHKQNGIYVEGISEIVISSIEDAYHFLNISNNNRAIAATKMSAASSRSHSVLMIELSQQNLSMESSKISKLFLVDLAGSERAHKTGAEGDRMQEAKNINLSLSALGKVINALTCGAPYVPYRDSKLTRVLQDSLGGNSKTSLIINCSPSNNNEHETITTLQFGTRAKTIKNQPKINKKITYHELELFIIKLAKDLEKSRKECEEITRSKNLEINNLLIQLENNQKIVVERNQMLESLNSRQTSNSHSFDNTFKEIENTSENSKIIFDDLNDLNDDNNNNNNNNNNYNNTIKYQEESESDQKENNEKDDEDQNNSSFDSIKVDDLRDLHDEPDIQDIILNSTVNNGSDDDDDDDETNGYLSHSLKDIKAPEISNFGPPISENVNEHSNDINNNNNGSNSGGLRVSTSYITSSPNVSPKINNNSPPLFSYFKTKDFQTQPLPSDENDKFFNDLATKQEQEHRQHDEENDDTKSTTSTTTTITTIDMNASQPSGIDDPIEFTIIKSDKTITSTLEREVAQPSSLSNSTSLLDIETVESSTLPAPPPVTTTTTLTTVTTTKLTKTTNVPANTNDINSIDDFGFSKIEEEGSTSNRKPNDTGIILFDDEDNESEEVIIDSDQDTHSGRNNLLNTFKTDHHRGDFGATPTKSTYNNNGNVTIKEFETPISSQQTLILQTTSANPSNFSINEEPLSPASSSSSTIPPPPMKKTKKNKSKSPWIILTIILVFSSLLFLYLPEYKERFSKRRDFLNALEIFSDYPTGEKITLYRNNQILLAKKLYGGSSKQYDEEMKTFITAYNGLIEMNYFETFVSNMLGSTIDLRIFSDDLIFNKTKKLKEYIHILESNKNVNVKDDEQHPIKNQLLEQLEDQKNLLQLNEDLKLEIKNQANSIKFLDKESKEKDNKIKEKDSEIKEKGEKIQYLESQILGQEKARNNTLVETVIELQEEKKDLLSKVSNLEGDKKSLGVLVNKFKSEKSELEIVVTKLEEKIEDLSAYPIMKYPTPITKVLNFISATTEQLKQYFFDVCEKIYVRINKI